MKTHVVIATTEGLAFIQRITEEEPGVQSVICFDGTAQVLPVSAGYHAFVRRGSGVVARDFGHDAFRIDVGARIDQGSSWQLPVYLAHALQARGDLGNGKPLRGDRVLWATGEIDVDLAVRPVSGVAQKLAHAIAPVRALREQGVEVQLLLPTANVGESAGHAEALGGVSGVTRLADVLPKPMPTGATASGASRGLGVKAEVAAMPLPRLWRWALISLVVLALVFAGSRYLQPELFPGEPVNDGRELDDFGGSGRDLKNPD